LEKPERTLARTYLSLLVAIIVLRRNSRLNILDLSYDELIRYLVKKKIERYRADQVLDWVYKKGVYHFNDMTNLPLTLR